MSDALLELSGVRKDYRGLRPLRIEQLTVERGREIALLGFDRPSAEIFVHLVTGAAEPDAGAVRVFGRSTGEIQNSSEWLTLVDRFGIVTPRAIFLEALSVAQNLALPFSLDIEPPPAEVRERVDDLAREIGVAPEQVEMRFGDLDPASRIRVALGRALALDPELVLLEHPTSGIPRSAVTTLGRDIRRVVEGRGVASVTLTADEAFADTVAAQVLRFDAATGRLTERRRGWFRSR